MFLLCFISSFFFFNDTATTEIYTLSLHDALPICGALVRWCTDRSSFPSAGSTSRSCPWPSSPSRRSEEHTSELQSRSDLVCRLLLEKKKKKNKEGCGARRRSRSEYSVPSC